MITLTTLRRYAVARTFFTPTTLPRAIAKLGFVQADPIRAPARAQDLMLRHRVTGYQAGDLERRYPRLAVEEDFFVNYGYLPRATQALMHPRTPKTVLTATQSRQMDAVLAFVQAQGVVHPRAVDAHFALGKTRNWFGGSSNASTQLLDDMHYRGLLRIAGRASGVRTYALPLTALNAPAPLEPLQALDALVDLIVHQYARRHPAVGASAPRGHGPRQNTPGPGHGGRPDLLLAHLREPHLAPPPTRRNGAPAGPV
jgi:uncharacterized protein